MDIFWVYRLNVANTPKLSKGVFHPNWIKTCQAYNVSIPGFFMRCINLDGIIKEYYISLRDPVEFIETTSFRPVIFNQCECWVLSMKKEDRPKIMHHTEEFKNITKCMYARGSESYNEIVGLGGGYGLVYFVNRILSGDFPVIDYIEKYTQEKALLLKEKLDKIGA